MVAPKVVVGSVLAAGASASGVSPLMAGIRARADLSPGSPLYNCHDNCGQAILEAQTVSSICNDNVFLTDYDNCLQCAGPDNGDIWKYYSDALTSAAAVCGLATTPAAGSQAAVGTALPGGADSSGSGASSPSAAGVLSSAPATTTSSSLSAGAALTDSSAAAADSSSAAATSRTDSRPTAGSGVSNSTIAGTGSPSVTTSAPSSVATSGASLRSVAACLAGIAALGVAYLVAF
ncbi:uncharacterized protein SPSK_09679 [Sporothrix schenckii 1099-18]|uniref:Uncharacterized protein n=2 Tax=Sporothrix schenckii TaxID=29908 RepID=U7PY04_SPOS1|nr:uncharacterized protein SPSK_09679 [Sporothrix schenckii 1099-18]ERT00458.1 hypothetical protein HMPREF1624_03831 [Sporothrix schenckii ATCC 58251]KJR85053.1 hypothetical protein SPSK_09679 [Sporothrix schenckii 1099-18]